MKNSQRHLQESLLIRRFSIGMYFYLFFFFSGSSCYSQIIITGILSDSTGTGIEFANMQIVAGKSYFLTTDSLGRFSQSISDPGLVEIKASHINYFPFDFAYRVYNDTTINISMINYLKSINEVVITGKKPDNNNNIILISPSDLEFSSKSLGEVDILNILQQKSGVAHTSEVSPGLYVRGMQQGNTGIFYGGTELFGVNHILSIYPQFNSEAISKARLLKADFDPAYGGYLSSMLLLEPDHQMHSKFAGSAELGVLNAKLTFMGPVVNDRISTKVSFRRSYFDLIANTYNRNNKNELPQYGFSEVNGSITWKSKSKGVFTLDLLGAFDKIKFDNSDISLSSNWKNYLVTAKWDLPLSEKTNFELLTGYTWFNLNAVLSNLFEHSIQNTIAQSSVSAKISYRLLNNLESESGADLKINRIDLETYAINYGTGNSSPISWAVPSENIALYETIKWYPLSDLKIKAGYRVGFYQSDTAYFKLMPFLSGEYEFNGYKINLSYAKLVQYKHLFIPTGINLPMNIWHPSQSDVPPAEAKHHNISITKNIFKGLSLSLSAYYIDLKKLTEFLDGNYFTSLEFITDQGHGYSEGIETSLTFKTRDIEIEGAFAISKSKRKFPLINEGTWFNPPFDIRHKADINILYKYGKKWVFTLSQFVQDGFIMTLPTSVYIHQQGDFTGKPNSEIIPVYTTRYNFRMPLSHRLDISAAYSFNWANKKALTTFGLYNVYNYQNPYFIYFTPLIQDNSSVIFESKKKSLLPMVPFVSLKISF